MIKDSLYKISNIAIKCHYKSKLKSFSLAKIITCLSFLPKPSFLDSNFTTNSNNLTTQLLVAKHLSLTGVKLLKIKMIVKNLYVEKMEKFAVI